MSNINEYLMWRGDILIDENYPFNEIDSMILARFSYLLFDKIDLKAKETIGSISEKMKIFPNDAFIFNGDKELITNLGKSPRFGQLIVTDYVKNTDKNVEKQFGAITIHTSESDLYISYIGTDMTLNGWKEDFNMAFMDTVPCQIDGKNYLEKIALKYPDKKMRIGGHSKGGNVAIYSAITVESNIQDRIIKVYNYDGPGFSKQVVNSYSNENILNKIETYIPQDSVIGRVLEHKEKMTVVLSMEKGIMQHDIFSWQIERNDIIKVDKNTNSSEDIDKTLTNWLSATTEEQRKIFVDTIFELFYSTDANTFKEFYHNLSSNIPKMLKKYGETSKEDKEVLMEMINLMIKSYVKIVKTRENIKLEKIKQEYINKGKVKIEALDKKYLTRFRKKKDETL